MVQTLTGPLYCEYNNIITTLQRVCPCLGQYSSENGQYQLWRWWRPPAKLDQCLCPAMASFESVHWELTENKQWHVYITYNSWVEFKVYLFWMNVLLFIFYAFLLVFGPNKMQNIFSKQFVNRMECFVIIHKYNETCLAFKFKC